LAFGFAAELLTEPAWRVGISASVFKIREADSTIMARRFMQSENSGGQCAANGCVVRTSLVHVIASAAQEFGLYHDKSLEGRIVLIRQRIASFFYAGRGVATLLKTQPNALIHAVASMGVVAAGFVLDVTNTEWCLLSLSMGLVWAAEALNTSIEFVVDLASPQHHSLAGKAKDVAAGGVLLAAIAAAVVGVIVFWPYVKQLLFSMPAAV